MVTKRKTVGRKVEGDWEKRKKGLGLIDSRRQAIAERGHACAGGAKPRLGPMP